MAFPQRDWAPFSRDALRQQLISHVRAEHNPPFQRAADSVRQSFRAHALEHIAVRPRFQDSWSIKSFVPARKYQDWQMRMPLVKNPNEIEILVH